MSMTIDEQVREMGIRYLQPQLDLIENAKVKAFVMDALQLYVPAYFFMAPASESGKYHPFTSLGVGGLLKHTRAALIIAELLFNIIPFKPKMKDCIRAAIVLHDTEKPSKTHPVEVKMRLEPLQDTYYIIYKTVISLIESHMGQWDQFGKMPRPKTKAEDFVHLCDYLSAKKELIVIEQKD